MKVCVWYPVAFGLRAAWGREKGKDWVLGGRPDTSFFHSADIPSRQRLRSSTSDDLCVPAARLPTVGRRAFSVAGARVWNALPADVTSAPSLFTFRKRLKLHLFPLSYPGLVL